VGCPVRIFVAAVGKAGLPSAFDVGAWLNWLFVAGRLRVHTEHNHNALTLPVISRNRFEDNSRLLRIFFGTGDLGVVFTNLLRLGCGGGCAPV